MTGRRGEKMNKAEDQLLLIDLGKEHALECVELCGHLLGEVLQVSGLNHLQTLTTQ